MKGKYKVARHGTARGEAYRFILHIDYDNASGWAESDEGQTFEDVTAQWPTHENEDLSSADFAAQFLIGANFHGSHLHASDFSEAILGLADFRDAVLTRARLRRADASHALLRRAALDFADLDSALLAGADLRGASLTGATLTGADLQDADLRGANITGADLTSTELEKVRLEGCVFDSSTRLPFPTETAERLGMLNGSTLNDRSVLIEPELKPETSLDRSTKSEDIEAMLNLADLDRRLQDLMTHAPSDASGTLTIIQTDDSYRGLITLTSTRGRVVAGSDASDLAPMIDDLFDLTQRRMREEAARTNES